MPVHVVKLTFSLHPSDMKKGQSMVKYTFLAHLLILIKKRWAIAIEVWQRLR